METKINELIENATGDVKRIVDYYEALLFDYKQLIDKMQYDNRVNHDKLWDVYEIIDTWLNSPSGQDGGWSETAFNDRVGQRLLLQESEIDGRLAK